MVAAHLRLGPLHEHVDGAARERHALAADRDDDVLGCAEPQPHAARALEVYQQALGGRGPTDFLYGDLLLAKARVQEQTKDAGGAIATYKQYLKDLPSADRVQEVRIRLALLGSAG